MIVAFIDNTVLEGVFVLMDEHGMTLLKLDGANRELVAADDQSLQRGLGGALTWRTYPC